MPSKGDVLYIANLARINLTEEEVARFTKDLVDILGYIEKLKELDVSAVQPTSHVLPIKNVFRKDTVKPSLGQEKAIQIAIEKHEGFFKVPKVIE